MGRNKSQPIVWDKSSRKLVGNPKLLSGLQAEVVGDLWRGSSSSGSGVWEVAMRRVGGNLHLVRVSCISDPLINSVPGPNVGRQLRPKLQHARIPSDAWYQCTSQALPCTNKYMRSKKLLHFSVPMKLVKKFQEFVLF